jgi:hypothetical protein
MGFCLGLILAFDIWRWHKRPIYIALHFCMWLLVFRLA